VEGKFGSGRLRLETGKVAPVADGSVMVSLGGHTLLCTAVGVPDTQGGNDFLPLTVEHISREFAFGRIPSNFRRTDMRSNDDTLVARAIDRALRPLFPKGFTSECQVITTLVSAGNLYGLGADVAAINGASAALHLSDIPWRGPIAAVRVVKQNDEFVVNPEIDAAEAFTKSWDVEPISETCAHAYEGKDEGGINLLYAGTEENAVMIEMAGVRTSEEDLRRAICLAQEHVREGINVIKKLKVETQEKMPWNKTSKDWAFTEAECQAAEEEGKHPTVFGFPSSSLFSTEAVDKTRSEGGQVQVPRNVSSVTPVALDYCRGKYEALYENPPQGRNDREKALWEVRHDTLSALRSHYKLGEGEGLTDEYRDEEKAAVNRLRSAVSKAESTVMREMAFRSGKRIDGRGIDEVRPLHTEVGIFPHTHGSALFTRGDTQVSSVTSVGHPQLRTRAQRLGKPAVNRGLYVTYEFPPYCTNEAGKYVSGRRELGHGELTEKGLRHSIPSNRPETFNVHTITTSSNGSSSMASVCAGSMALLHAGVDLNGGPVAGISMGLFSLPLDRTDEEDLEYLVVTDIMGLEDYLGDMDFKIAGTLNGITAIQLDTKLPGIPLSVVFEAISKSKDARKTVLDAMASSIEAPRVEARVPRLEYIELRMWERKDLKSLDYSEVAQIEAATGCNIRILKNNIEIFGLDENRRVVRELIQEAVGELIEGKLYTVRVVRCEVHGVMVELADYEGGLAKLIGVREGFIHWKNSGIRTKSPENSVEIGQEFRALCIGHEPLTGRPEFSVNAVRAMSPQVIEDGPKKSEELL